jgi:hypothetical protein
LLANWWRAGPSRLETAVQAMAADSVALGRRPEPLADTLQRERLHRLNRLATETPATTPQ